jgi:hypothetical protein
LREPHQIDIGQRVTNSIQEHEIVADSVHLHKRNYAVVDRGPLSSAVSNSPC